MMDIEVGQTVWITVFALTKGAVKGIVSDVTDRATINLEGDWRCYSKREYFTSEAEAQKDVLSRIEAKRQLIDKQLAKLEKLEQKVKKALKALE